MSTGKEVPQEPLPPELRFLSDSAALAIERFLSAVRKLTVAG